MDLGPVELRVLGCLIEKQRTTPDQYPLSLNALRLACNQSTNRDPVVDYDEHEIREALTRLGDRGWTRLTSGPGSRAAPVPPPHATSRPARSGSSTTTAPVVPSVSDAVRNSAHARSHVGSSGTSIAASISRRRRTSSATSAAAKAWRARRSC